MSKLWPEQIVRDFDGRVFIGKTANIALSNTSRNTNTQYVSIELINGAEISGRIGQHASHPLWCCSDRIPLVIGHDNHCVDRVIRDVSLIERDHNGRHSMRTAQTYWGFFNDEQKQVVQQYNDTHWLTRQLSRRGNPLECDVVVTFDDFKMYSSWNWCCAPGEWTPEPDSEKEADDD